MSIANVTDYLLPLGLLLVYFFVSSGKKTKKQHSSKPTHTEEKEFVIKTPSFRRSEPATKRQVSLHSQLEHRTLESHLEKEELKHSTQVDLSYNILSQEMQRYTEENVHKFPPVKKAPSRAACLFRQQGSLKKAFLIKEVLNRPYEE